MEVAIERALGRHLVGQAAEAGARKLGFESNVVTVDGFDALTSELNDRKAPTELVKAAGTVEALREVKDAGEVALLRLACEAADAALTDLVARGGLRPGRTEREVSRELEALMLDHGADAISFETIVAAGRTRRSRIIAPPTPRWRPVISSRSTSARWSAATTPT